MHAGYQKTLLALDRAPAQAAPEGAYAYPHTVRPCAVHVRVDYLGELSYLNLRVGLGEPFPAHFG